MATLTRNIVGPGSKVYAADFPQAENMNSVMDVVSAAGLTLEQINNAIRREVKLMYLAALESTVDSKIETAYQSLLVAGFDADEARIVAESKRAKLDSGLPKGLKDLNRVSKRGRKSDAEKAAEGK